MISNFLSIRDSLPVAVKLVVISKNRTVSEIQALYAQGHRTFGENRVQELLGKVPQLPADIDWHLVGHLQTNKVKQIVSLVKLIHSADSLKLLKEIDKASGLAGKKTGCLLQFHISQEQTKFGFDPFQAFRTAWQIQNENFINISIEGVMGMATLTNDTNQIRNEFKALYLIYTSLATITGFLSGNIVSMGMSSDFRMAIEEGANMIRLGSILFDN